MINMRRGGGAWNGVQLKNEKEYAGKLLGNSRGVRVCNGVQWITKTNKKDTYKEGVAVLGRV